MEIQAAPKEKRNPDFFKPIHGYLNCLFPKFCGTDGLENLTRLLNGHGILEL